MKRNTNTTTNSPNQPSLPHNTYPLSSLICQHAFSFQSFAASVAPFRLKAKSKSNLVLLITNFGNIVYSNQQLYIEHDNIEPYVHTIVTVKVSNKQNIQKNGAWILTLLEQAAN